MPLFDALRPSALRVLHRFCDERHQTIWTGAARSDTLKSMAKVKFSDVINFSGSMPEWGVSPEVSSAAPLVVSGAQFKSTNQLGLAMENILRHKTTDHVDFQALANLKLGPKKKKKVAFKAKKRK